MLVIDTVGIKTTLSRRWIDGTLANAASEKYEKAEGIVRQTRDRGEHCGIAEDYISFRPQYPNLQMRNSSTLWSHTGNFGYARGAGHSLARYGTNTLGCQQGCAVLRARVIAAFCRELLRWGPAAGWETR
jgi:hypothetical protein